ncbi:hypothetical protein LWI28_022164 [Acer negundo]|uniref:RRM domain-containing protein n=1 Tax=Acer negundo TaxID=4023 RepID=A0AAD5NHY0_ACENE|nr:hypothetical protein LWI28_022164 [Acer negundo]
MNNINNNSNIGQFGDTTLTKVFVGGLAWETPKEAMREHFDKYGDILEAVIISDKLTGRSKGYGSNVGPRSTSAAPPANHVQWYYPAGTHATPFHHHQQQHHHHHQAVPFYGYSPTYIAADVSYNHKLSYTGGGSYMNGHYPQVYQGQPIGNTLMPMYPLYHIHQSQTMGLPAHIYPPTNAGPMTTVPAIISKPPPNTGTLHIRILSCALPHLISAPPPNLVL